MTPLLEQFLSESRDFLQGISEKLMQLEKAPNDPNLMTELFRYVHTLKGNSGLFDFPEMTKVLHAGEDLMDAVRNGKIAYSQALADCLLDAMDFVSVLCDEIEESGTIGTQHAKDSARLADRLRQFMVGESKSDSEDDNPNNQSAIEATNPIISLGDLQTSIPTAIIEQIRQATERGDSIYYLSYTPEENCFFSGEDPFHQAKNTPNLIWGGISATEPWPTLDQLDAYRCVLQFRILANSALERLQEHFRYSMEQVSISLVVLQANVTASESVQTGKHENNQQSEYAVLAELLNSQLQVLNAQNSATWQQGSIKAVVAALTGCMQFLGYEQNIVSMQQAAAASVEAKESEPLVAWLRGFITSFETNNIPAQTVTDSVNQVTVNDSEVKTAKRNEDLTTIPKSVKVDQEKIDRLMSLIGEMVVAKNALPYLAGRAEAVFGARELSREIKMHYSVINRIAEEMQDAIMQVRMMPVSFVFQRFPRLVRDISRKLGKEINLVLEGEDTEADKNIIESLGDPLVHIVRNSLDHGFELPHVRSASGKPSIGTLTISAKHESDRVFIEIKDDGKGIDPDVVKMKAYQKGLISKSELESISDQAAQNLIFAPGFSTSDVVSDLSGRGVGMDVVKTAVEKVNGSILLESLKGKGTSIRLSLPLSMAVTNVMIVESDGQDFGVPMDSVFETVRVKQSDIKTIKTSHTTVLRGNIIPLKSMNSLLG